MSEILKALAEPTFIVISLGIIGLAILVLVSIIFLRRYKRRVVREAYEALSKAQNSLQCDPAPSQRMFLDKDTIKAAQIWVSKSVGYRGEIDGKVNPDLLTALTVAERYGTIPTQFENIVAGSNRDNVLVRTQPSVFNPRRTHTHGGIPHIR